LLLLAVVSVSTLLAYLFTGWLVTVVTTVFGLGLPEIVTAVAVGGGTHVGLVLGIIGARSMACDGCGIAPAEGPRKVSSLILRTDTRPHEPATVYT
jgi:hypothetical protein